MKHLKGYQIDEPESLIKNKFKIKGGKCIDL